ncbi:uncharacterized protein [Spinacia oleracea]|uniref:Uncharacterized protein isoform X1 n=1 Tax=Spinacia oleracea TaxID=3562 RepID=A0A9R0JX64_SPIOL|nr:uncharacterized protein LOC110789967 isoform X1 [Spinacia oleracea]
MEKSEPSLVPEWLRSNGGGSSGHHSVSSQADGPLLALPKRNRPSKSISNSDSPLSSLLDQSFSSNSRRNLSSNVYTKHDKNYGRSYSGFPKSQRDKDRERISIADNWDSEYSESLRDIITRRGEDTLGRSQSMILRRQGEVAQRRVSNDPRSVSHTHHDNGNGVLSVRSSVTGVQKLSFERDFPVLGFDERPKTPDVIRVSSPDLSRGIQSLSIVNPPLVCSEGWTSALAEAPTGAGSNSNGSSSVLQSSAAAASGYISSSGVGSTLHGLNMAETLAQASPHSYNVPQPSIQTQRDELAITQSRILIPMTPKTLGPTSSDKLKPKTPVRSSEAAGVSLKNGMQHLSPLQIGSPAARGSSVRVDSPNSPSGKLLLRKPGRENGASSVFKDIQSPTTNASSRVPDGQSAGLASVVSLPLKNSHNPKVSSGERKNSASGLNAGLADKRSSLAQAQSRSDFFKLMREKSVSNTAGTADPETAVSSDTVDKSVKELKELTSVSGTSVGNGSELKCNGETWRVADSLFLSKETDNEAINPDEEERAFLISLGWDDNAGDEEVITEEEIHAFCLEVMKGRQTPRVCRLLQAKTMSHSGLHPACSGAASTESSASASQTEA